MKKKKREVIIRSLKYTYKSGPHGTTDGKQPQKHVGFSSSFSPLPLSLFLLFLFSPLPWPL